MNRPNDRRRRLEQLRRNPAPSNFAAYLESLGYLPTAMRPDLLEQIYQFHMADPKLRRAYREWAAGRGLFTGGTMFNPAPRQTPTPAPKKQPRRRRALDPGLDRRRVESATRARLEEIRDLNRSGTTAIVGKVIRDPLTEKVIGRHGLNLAKSYPELAQSGLGPAKAAAAIERGKGKEYQRIREEAERYVIRAYGEELERQPRPAAARIAPHEGLRRCSICEQLHRKDQHRAHGIGSFARTHPGHGYAGAERRALASERYAAGADDFSFNPPRWVQIYQAARGVIIQGMQKGPGHQCSAECRRAGHRYVHRFAGAVEVIGLPNGDVLLHSPDND